MSTGRGPNPLFVAWTVYRAQRVARPRPAGETIADHEALGVELKTLRREGISVLPSRRSRLAAYRDYLETLDPDGMNKDEALAYWLNLYNAGALTLAADATEMGQGSVLRVPGAFTRSWARVAGVPLSLTEIEHGKVRRFHDPRIHGALVCGSASCPNLRFEPFTGAELDDQLDDQLRNFLILSGASIDRARGRLLLSRIFLWYGGDFTRPDRMPTWLPPPKNRLAAAVGRWLDADTRAWVEANQPKVVFRPYDWELNCAIA